MGKIMYDRRIWPVEIEEPFSIYLGIDNTIIPTVQIPFQHNWLETGDIIENEFKEQLYYVKEDNGYYLISPDKTRWLVNWFTKWEKI